MSIVFLLSAPRMATIQTPRCHKPHHFPSFSHLLFSHEPNNTLKISTKPQQHFPLHCQTTLTTQTQTPTNHQQQFTTSYLINTCGLSPDTALEAAQKVKLQSPERPDAVVSLFKELGFSKTQISNLVRRRPVLLLSDIKNTLLPKIEFFQSIGVSESDLAKALSLDPTILTRSLENQLIPSYNYLKSVLECDKKIAAAFRRTSWIFLEDHMKNLAPNIELLRRIGVPDSCVKLLLSHFPEALMQRREKFGDIVEEVKEMGFDMSKSMFVLAVHAISGKGNKSIWYRCYENYKKWGWSDDDITSAFKLHPHTMILSEKKIMKAMDFFVNKMGWPSRSIAKCPIVLFFSLEKRIIPRCSVIRVLLSKELIKQDISLVSVLVPVEDRFLDKFVFKFIDEVPELLSVYEQKLAPEQV